MSHSGTILDMEIRRVNMQYLRLDDAQYDRHCKLMGLPMKQWPRLLVEYVRAQSRRDGVSGDSVNCWVADWIRNEVEGRGHSDE